MEHGCIFGVVRWGTHLFIWGSWMEHGDCSIPPPLMFLFFLILNFQNPIFISSSLSQSMHLSLSIDWKHRYLQSSNLPLSLSINRCSNQSIFSTQRRCHSKAIRGICCKISDEPDAIFVQNLTFTLILLQKWEVLKGQGYQEIPCEEHSGSSCC